MNTKPEAKHTPTPHDSDACPKCDRFHIPAGINCPLEHSSLPWMLIDDEDNVEVYIDGQGVGERGMIVCNRNENGSANAEFIVRTVNSHEALLEAAKTALSEFESLGLAQHELERTKLRKAIAQAEGKV